LLSSVGAATTSRPRIPLRGRRSVTTVMSSRSHLPATHSFRTIRTATTTCSYGGSRCRAECSASALGQDLVRAMTTATGPPSAATGHPSRSFLAHPIWWTTTPTLKRTRSS
jgi:hypothetical protein